MTLNFSASTQSYSDTELLIKFIEFVAITFHLRNFHRVLSHCKKISKHAVKLNFHFRDNFYFAIVGE